MSEVLKLESDKKLIAALFNIMPLDHCRRKAYHGAPVPADGEAVA